MTKEEAKKQYDNYSQYDENFRAAKKRGDFRKASEYKAKRDAINLAEVLKVLKSNQ